MAFDANQEVSVKVKAFKHTYVAASGTTVIKASPGFLHSVSWTAVPGVTAGTVRVYNHESTTTDLMFDINVGTSGTIPQNGTAVLNVVMDAGIVVNLLGTTTGTVTISYA